MKAVLISTYDLGHQPFGLASPAAWLRAAGHQVACADLSLDPLPLLEVREADLIAFYLPMHTATRLAADVIRRVRRLNPSAHLCCYGLYAPLNADYLREIGVQSIIGGEFEAALVRIAGGDNSEEVSLERLQFHTPERTRLPVLVRYPRLLQGRERRVTGYTEASRGCKHLCRHCPVVPVYKGAFRVVQRDVVLADIRTQVAAGAQHITFGDPDFFNGPTHARHLIEAFHQEFPALSYDVTIKVEHLLRHRDMLPLLRDTGCLFVTSAVESIDDAVLEKLDKGHTAADFFEVARLFREYGLTLAPTFIAFTPWTTLDGYRHLLEAIAALELIGNVGPVQLALRLLISSGSRLLELPEIQSVITGFDQAGLCYRWKHPDPEVDDFGRRCMKVVAAAQHPRLPRHEVFAQIWELAHSRPAPEDFKLMPRTTIPYMEEPWYC